MRHPIEPNRDISSDQTRSRGYTWIVGLVLTIHCVLLACEARLDSPTWDEFGHLIAGVSHWKFGRFDLYPVNPPLVRMAATSLPICLHFKLYESVGASQGGTNGAFLQAFDVAKDLGDEFFEVVFLARLACIPFSILGGIICYLWGRDLFGNRSGIMAVVWWSFSPTVLGHGHLMTPDVGATSLGLCASYAFWKWLRTADWNWCLSAGFLLGLALLAKFTLLILLFCWPCLWLLWIASGGLRNEWRRSVRQAATMLVISVGTVNAGYGFEGSFERLGDYPLTSRWLRPSVDAAGEQRQIPRNRFSETVFAGVRVPLPWNYIAGADRQAHEFERGFWSYLRGEWRQRGWWYYYLYAWVIKEPLGTWCLAFASLIWLVVHCSRRGTSFVPRVAGGSWLDWCVLVVPAVVIVGLVSSQTGFNHHLRYILPAFPFCFIALSACATCVSRLRPIVSSGVLVCSGWMILSSLGTFPHSLSYFNELVGGPMGGPDHLSDSNVDWGQDLFHLRRWYEKHPEARPLRVTYLLQNMLDPRLVEPTFEIYAPAKLMTADGPPLAPGWYAVSVCSLFRFDSGCDAFREHQPVGRAGYGIYIYHILPKEPAGDGVRLNSADGSAIGSGR